MPIIYAWTEQLDTLDAGGAVTATEIKKHSITWQDADRTIYNGAAAGTKAAIATSLGAMALTVNQKAEADYTVAGNKAAQLALFPTWFAQAGAAADSHIAGDALAMATAFASAFGPLIGSAPSSAPQVITGPGQSAKDPKGSVLTMDAAGGVYRDARKMQGIAAAKLVVIGNAIFGLGKTVPSWWQWNGTNWGTTPITDGDPGVLV